ncbi:MAG: formyltransferase family protein [Bacteroidota bacterium]
MEKIIFLGSRTHVFDSAIKMGVTFKHIFALKGSLLESSLISRGIQHKSFDMAQKKEVLDFLYESNFEVLVSNGCPIVFPVDKFHPSQILVNIHPTYLPFLQGKTPLNGVFYNDYKFYGATMHFIDATIDTGNVIYQHKEEITPDIDLGLLYFLAFELEGFVFRKGWEVLKAHRFNYNGERQQGKADYFNRTKEKQQVDFKLMGNKELMRKVKSFGIASQGCYAKLNDRDYRIFEVEEIVHPALLQRFGTSLAGEILLAYDKKLLVKSKDGILKLKVFQEEV